MIKRLEKVVSNKLSSKYMISAMDECRKTKLSLVVEDLKAPRISNKHINLFRKRKMFIY